MRCRMRSPQAKITNSEVSRPSQMLAGWRTTACTPSKISLIEKSRFDSMAVTAIDASTG